MIIKLAKVVSKEKFLELNKDEFYERKDGTIADITDYYELLNVEDYWIFGSTFIFMNFTSPDIPKNMWYFQDSWDDRIPISGFRAKELIFIENEFIDVLYS